MNAYFLVTILLFDGEPSVNLQVAILVVGILCAALGGLTLLLIRGIYSAIAADRKEIAAIREKGEQNSKDIEHVRTRCDTIQQYGCRFPTSRPAEGSD